MRVNHSSKIKLTKCQLALFAVAQSDSPRNATQEE